MILKNVARRFFKHCRWFFISLPVIFRNHGRCFFMLWVLFKNNVRNENFYVKNLYFLIGKVHIFALEMNIILLKRVRVG